MSKIDKNVYVNLEKNTIEYTLLYMLVYRLTYEPLGFFYKNQMLSLSKDYIPFLCANEKIQKIFSLKYKKV